MAQCVQGAWEKCHPPGHGPLPSHRRPRRWLSLRDSEAFCRSGWAATASQEGTSKASLIPVTFSDTGVCFFMLHIEAPGFVNNLIKAEGLIKLNNKSPSVS